MRSAPVMGIAVFNFRLLEYIKQVLKKMPQRRVLQPGD
jgi:hypothetical protein